MTRIEALIHGDQTAQAKERKRQWGFKLRQLRTSTGLPLTHAAAQAGITREQVRAIENCVVVKDTSLYQKYEDWLNGN